MVSILESNTLKYFENCVLFCKVKVLMYKSKYEPNMTFGQTILLIFSQICIETKWNLKLSKNNRNCAKMFILHTITNVVFLSNHYTYLGTLYISHEKSSKRVHHFWLAVFQFDSKIKSVPTFIFLDFLFLFTSLILRTISVYG